MKKYNVYLYYYEEDGLYAAVCPDFFNFILYHDNEEDLKHSILHSLCIYSNNFELNDNDINYILIDKENLKDQINQTEPISLL